MPGLRAFHSATTTFGVVLSKKIKKRNKVHLPPGKLGDSALSLVSLGAALLNQGRPSEAVEAWRKAAELDPVCVPAWTYLTDFLSVSERTEEATVCLNRLIAISAKTAENLFILADKACLLKENAQARQFLQEALTLDAPPQVRFDVHFLLAKLDCNDGHWIAAAEHASRALEIEPEHAEALEVRLTCYASLTWLEEEISDTLRYLKLKPDAELHNRMLLKLNCSPTTTPESLYAESVRWSDLYAAPLAGEILPHSNSAQPERRLKIGYLSPDFRGHAIMKLLPCVLENHDRQNFEIFAYSVATKHDETTELVKGMVEHFVELAATRNEIADRVRADGIDILVDLAGHSMPMDAFLALALKPAPVQISWLGVIATTGLSTVDYFIGDQHIPCPGTEHLFSEQIYRLPRVLTCFRPLADPGVTAPPCFSNGFITFGSFNDTRKISRDLVKVWSVILHLHPGSRMLLKSLTMDKEIVQQRFREWFLADGIAADRLRFEGPGTPFNFLCSVNAVDVALDTVPYAGGTTTLETLWMGVPVVSMAGRLAVSEQASSLLPAVGLPVASTLGQYIALASELTKGIPQQPESRAQLRTRFRQSPLMDERGMTHAIEAAYRDLWRHWCAARPETKR